MATFPKSDQWHTYAGGTGAAPGKYSYDYTVGGPISAGGKQYSISPVSTQYGRHRGYQASVFPGRNHGHEQIGLYRSTQAAKSACKKWHEAHATQSASNPRRWVFTEQNQKAGRDIAESYVEKR